MLQPTKGDDHCTELCSVQFMVLMGADSHVFGGSTAKYSGLFVREEKKRRRFYQEEPANGRVASPV